jgi:hypothetical protein
MGEQSADYSEVSTFGGEHQRGPAPSIPGIDVHPVPEELSNVLNSSLLGRIEEIVLHLAPLVDHLGTESRPSLQYHVSKVSSIGDTLHRKEFGG